MFKKVKPCEFVDDCLKIKILRRDIEKGVNDKERMEGYYKECMRGGKDCQSRDFYLKYPELTELNSSQITYVWR